MKRALIRGFLALLLLAGWSCHEELPSPDLLSKDDLVGHVTPVLGNRYIVVISDEVVSAKSNSSVQSSRLLDEKSLREAIADFSIAETQIVHLYSEGFFGFTAYLSKEDAERLRRDRRIIRVEQDVSISFPDINGIADPGARTAPVNILNKTHGDLIPAGVKRVGGPVEYKGKQVVYIVDCGIDLGNKELNVNVSRGFNGIYDGDDSKSLQDLLGHGTHVAGIIGAKMDGEGIAGVAAGATVVPIKILDKNGNGTYSGVLAALDHILKDGCKGDVVNMSVTGPPTPTLEALIIKAAEKGIHFVFAAGNNSDHANNYSPGRLNGKYFTTVSAMDENDVFATFSNYGNPPIDWCAPGVGILSTWIKGQYNFRNGTSYAAPHVAGLILLGGPVKDGLVKDDPDGECDPIAVHKCP